MPTAGTALTVPDQRAATAHFRGKKYPVLLFSCFIFFFCIAATGAAPFGAGNGIGSYIVATIAGRGIQGNLDGSMERAQFNWPAGIAVDDNGNIYVADSGNNRVRKISQGGGILQAKLFLP